MRESSPPEGDLRETARRVLGIGGHLEFDGFEAGGGLGVFERHVEGGVGKSEFAKPGRDRLRERRRSTSPCLGERFAGSPEFGFGLSGTSLEVGESVLVDGEGCKFRL